MTKQELVGPSPKGTEPTEELTEDMAVLTEKLSVEEWSDQQLFNEIKSFLRDHIDFTDESTYTICACYALVCKRYRQFTTLPYLFFLGPPASGKSTAMKVLASVLENAKRTASMTPPVLFHILGEVKPDLLCIDESEILNDSKSSPEYLAILNSGYEVGTPVSRLVLNAKNSYDVKDYDVFGPKLLAGTKEFRYPTILSRCITVNMERRCRKIRFTLDEEQAETIRQQLNMYKTRHLNTPPKPYDPEAYCSDRLAQLFQPLFQVAPTPGIESELKQMAKEMSLQRQLSEQSGIENMIVRAFDYHANGQTVLTDLGPLEAGSRDVFETFKGYWGVEYGYDAAEKWSSKGFWTKARPLGFERIHTRNQWLMRILRDRFTRLKQRFCGETETQCGGECDACVTHPTLPK